MSDFAIWNKALSSDEVSELLQYSGHDSRAKGPIDLSLHSAKNNLQVWYRMGDGSSITGQGDAIGTSEQNSANNRIFNNAFRANINIGSHQFNATPGYSSALTIVDVSDSLPGDYYIQSQQSIISGSQDVMMNVGYSLGFDRDDDVYQRARNLDAQNRNSAIGTGSTHNNSRVVRNYNEPPISTRYYPVAITLHGDRSYTPSMLRSFDVSWERGFDPRLPRFFVKRENTQKLTQLNRERSWNLDNKYYQDITNNMSLSEREELGYLGKYSISYGQVSIKKTFGNDIVTFGNQQIIKDSSVKEPKNSEVVPFLDLLIDENDALHDKLMEISYTEAIYPREINTYSKEARGREKFDFFGWKLSRDNRKIILEGNVQHTPSDYLYADENIRAFPAISTNDSSDYKRSFFGTIDAVDVSSSVATDLKISANITSSVWPLDSRQDLTILPISITSSYIKSASAFLSTREQGTRGEGILQNDFSTFPLGYNGLYGTPPFSLVYNRRIPQKYGNNDFLAGEAKWEAATGSFGPFYDSYVDYAHDDLRPIAKDHSVVPEFRMSDFVEEVLNGEREYPDGRSLENPLSFWPDFLSLTGSVHADKDGNLDISGQSFKTYSNSDFLRYFEVVDNEVFSEENPASPSRLTLKCKAAMKFLPYKGFYPAERVVQIYELFHNNYLDKQTLQKVRVRQDSPRIVSGFV